MMSGALWQVISGEREPAMQWWAWLWLALLLAMTVGGVALDLRDRETVWRTTSGLSTGLFCTAAVLDHFGYVAINMLAIFALPVLILIIDEVRRDIRADDALSTAGKIASGLLPTAVFAPAAVLPLLKLIAS